MCIRDRKSGIEQPQSKGWIHWSQRIGRMFPDVARSAARATRIIHFNLFGRGTTSSRDVEYLWRFYRRFKRLSGERVKGTDPGRSRSGGGFWTRRNGSNGKKGNGRLTDA